MKPFPKDILGYVYNPSGTFFHIIVVLANQPGALKDIAERLATTKLNILQGFHSATPGAPQGVWSLFVESKNSKITTEQVRKIVESSKLVLDCEIRKSVDGFLIDDFHFPVRIAPNQDAIILSPKAVRGMLEDIVRKYGSWGEAMVYHAGVEVGRIGSSIAAEAVGDAFASLSPRLIKIFNASGLGQVEITDLSLDPLEAHVRVASCFECSGLKKRRPACHFMRGIIAGGTDVGFGTSTSCEEVKCMASGDPFCDFVVKVAPSK